MSQRKSECPSCGAPVPFKSVDSLYVVCSYCNTTSLREGINLKELGKAASVIEDGTPIQIGSIGKYKGDQFEVIGRIQLKFDVGFWNEWHLTWRGQSAWLGETNGQYVFTTELKERSKNIKAFNEYQIGNQVELDGEDYYASDIQNGRCVTGQGELPFSFKEEYQAPVIDFISNKEKFATIDFSEDEPIIFTGEYVDFDDLHLTNLRDLYNWYD